MIVGLHCTVSYILCSFINRQWSLATYCACAHAAQHVDSTNTDGSNLVFRSKPIPEAEMSNWLIGSVINDPVPWAHFFPLVQCCPTFLTPRAAQDLIMKPRAAPVNSKVTTKICWILIYCFCVIVIFWNQRLFIMYAHATFDKLYPFSVTNCQKSRTPSP